MVHITLTPNEFRTLNFLIRHFTEKYSINQLAKKISITPKGIHKLLKKLEREQIVKFTKLANSLFYQVNLESETAKKCSELALIEDIESSYARVQAKDLESLKKCVISAVLFGSVLTKGEKAGDIDVLVVVEKKKYNEFRKALEKIQSLKPKHIQTVIQSQQDLINNLKKKDEVLLEILRTGRFLWGTEVIVNIIKEVAE